MPNCLTHTHASNIQFLYTRLNLSEYPCNSFRLDHLLKNFVYKEISKFSLSKLQSNLIEAILCTVQRTLYNLQITKTKQWKWPTTIAAPLALRMGNVKQTIKTNSTATKYTHAALRHGYVVHISTFKSGIVDEITQCSCMTDCQSHYISFCLV